jgi:WD40 repeat protein
LETLSLIKIKKLCVEKVRSIDINYHISEIAVASGDCHIRIFDLKTLEEKKTFIAHTLSANIVKYAPNGNILLSGGRDAYLNMWDTKNYTQIKSIAAHNFAIYDIVYNPNAKLFATASRDKTIKIWNAQTFEMLVRISKENYEGHVNSVNKLNWMKYNNYLVSTGDDRSILVWEIK